MISEAILFCVLVALVKLISCLSIGLDFSRNLNIVYFQFPFPLLAFLSEGWSFPHPPFAHPGRGSLCLDWFNVLLMSVDS